VPEAPLVDLKRSRVLLTGGSGFLGTAVHRVLADREELALAEREFVAAERARCAAVCREVATATRADGGNPYDGRAEVADECAEAIERGAVER